MNYYLERGFNWTTAAITVSFPRKKFVPICRDARQPLGDAVYAHWAGSLEYWDWQDDIEREGHDFNRVGLFTVMISRMVFPFRWNTRLSGGSRRRRQR